MSGTAAGGGELVIQPERAQSPDVVEIKLGSPPLEVEEEEEEDRIIGYVTDSSSVSVSGNESFEDEEVVYKRRVGSKGDIRL